MAELDFWVVVLEPFPSISVLNASIPAVKSLVDASTRTFRIDTQDVTTLPTTMPDLTVCAESG